MKMSLEFILCLLAAATGVASQHVMGNDERPAVNCVNLPVTLEAQPGENVTVECRYPTTAGTIARHFCREDGKFTCANLISVSQVKHAIKGRFSMRAGKEHGVFAVTIFTLSRKDSGRYRCDMEKFDNNITSECLTRISLIVSNSTGVSWSQPWIIVGMVTALVFLATSVAALLALRSKLKVQVRCPARGSPEPETNAGSRIEEHHYEEIQTSDGQANLLPTVYATVAPTHQLIYTTITFQGSTAAVPADSSKPYDANDSSSLARD